MDKLKADAGGGMSTDGVIVGDEPLPVCAGCGEPIPDDRWVRDEGRMWHARCHPESSYQRTAGAAPSDGGKQK